MAPCRPATAGSDSQYCSPAKPSEFDIPYSIFEIGFLKLLREIRISNIEQGILNDEVPDQMLKLHWLQAASRRPLKFTSTWKESQNGWATAISHSPSERS